MIDCSHANSNKNHELQASVFHDVVDQSISNKQIIGTMLESNINSGKQAFPQDKENLQYGVSVTDACIDWETTEKSLTEMADKLREVLKSR